jgi:hypothetical protein
MKKALFNVLFCFFVHASSVWANVYVVFYMTEQGSTGHVGIAVDNYKVIVREQWEHGSLRQWEDTVATGYLTFFDLWPERDVRYWRFNKNTPPRYFQFPRTSAEAGISPESLLYEGLPHRYRRPCDALVCIATSARVDSELMEFIAELEGKRPYYNARRYNCADFVCLCLQKVLYKKIRAREFIPFSMTSTPNKLFLKLKKTTNNVQVLLDPGNKVHGSFFVERILKNKS